MQHTSNKALTSRTIIFSHIFYEFNILFINFLLLSCGVQFVTMQSMILTFC